MESLSQTTKHGGDLYPGPVFPLDIVLTSDDRYAQRQLRTMF